MFGNDNNTTTTTTGAAPSGMLTMEELLGKKVTDAAIIEGGAKPKGSYVFQLTEIDQGEYEIKKEEHARVGETAMMLTFVLKILQVDPKGKYVNVKGRRLSPEEMQEFIGKDFKENVMFGNDGLQKPDGSIDNSGFNKFVTLLSKIIGEEKYKELEANGASTQQLIEAAQGVKFLADISHNTYNGNTNDQLDLFGDFEVVPA